MGLETSRHIDNGRFFKSLPYPELSPTSGPPVVDTAFSCRGKELELVACKII